MRTKPQPIRLKKNAWKLGYELAEQHGIEFSDNAKKWGADQLESYLIPDTPSKPS